MCRLDRHQRRGLEPAGGHDHDGGGVDELQYLRGRHPAGDDDPVLHLEPAGLLLEPGPVDPIAGDRQPNIGNNARDGRQGVHDQVEALVRDDAAEAE